jgi:DNA mismatch endonuclease Vsr
MDNLSVRARSALMGRIRSHATRPEAIVVRLARQIRPHFQINSKHLAGRPDLAFFRLKCAVFVHGCFWHQHPDCRRSNVPRVLVILECQCDNSERLNKRLHDFLKMPRPLKISSSRRSGRLLAACNTIDQLKYIGLIEGI